MATLPARIREACGVERFDVAESQNTLVACYEAMEKFGVTDELALQIIGSVWRTRERELTTKPARATT